MRTRLLALALTAALTTSACVTDREMYVPVDSALRGPKDVRSVVLLDKEPDWPYTVIGIITPPPAEYDSMAEALNAARRTAARHGADAILVQSAETNDFATRRMSVFQSGTQTLVHLTVKAIVRK